MNEKKKLTTKETFSLALQNHQKNRLQVAENLYKKILKINPNHFESIFLLGTLLAETKKFVEAKQMLTKAIQIKPNHALAHNNLGIIFKELGKHQEALACYKNAILVNPNHTLAVNNLSMLLKESQLSNLTQTNSSSLKELILLLLKRNDINHKDIFRNARSFLFIEEKN